ncbi:uncharacterized protein PAC_08871 [Phialocephala subalpina]|uniref:Uncharacterized protein n=1 Tax=Phialocephala subalpina TaxID=576137 RepID=A0A1L7X1Y2_9HELO|nr:uncharacterized protein PAC_08871 [Phialocephala subalpina]
MQVFELHEPSTHNEQIAAAHLRTNACKVLLSCGVRGNPAETMTGRTALHIAAGKSGMYDQYEGDDPLLEAIDNFYRKDNTLEIIRLLVERADCDPMAERFESSQPLLDSGVTAMHLHKGLAEPMKRARSEISLLEGTDDEQQLEIQGLIVDGLRLGLNVHAAIDTLQTPFLELSQKYWLKKRDLHHDFCERLLVWFKLLHEAGHVLQAYIFKEERMLPYPSAGSAIDGQRTFKKPSREPESSNSRIYSFHRRMLLEERKHADDIILHVEEDFIWSKENRARIHKGEKPRYTDLMKEYAVELWGKQRVSILIAPLHDGEQELRVLSQE